MRPIKLTISAFGPYATEQVIDFEELNGRNIFVISGKTGAGKTTIFDAICYALYGEASGESRDTDSLRSHFADEDRETYVELKFELRGKNYTIKRLPKQKKKKARGEGYTEKDAEAILTLPDGKPITKVKNVTDKVVEILGITRDQFKQIVMLPQGEFKKLLLADSVERETIFRKIFNTYDFEKIQNELKDKAIALSKARTKSKDKMQTNLENIKGDHDIDIGEYVDFPLVIEKLKELLKRDSEGYKALENKFKDLDEKLQVKGQEKVNIENNNNLLKEKEGTIIATQELLHKKEEYKGKAETIAKAKKAKEVSHQQVKLEETENKLERRKKDYDLSVLSVENLKGKVGAAKESLRAEESREVYREKLNVEIEKLTTLQPMILEFQDLKNTVIGLDKSCEETKIHIEKIKAETEELKREKVLKEENIKEISRLETEKVKLDNFVERKNKTIDEIRSLYKIIKAYEENNLNHIKEVEKYKEFEKDYIAAKNEYETKDNLYKKEQAGILASQLQESMPCPVCGSMDHPSPATIKNNGKIPTQEELKKAKERSDKLEKENLEKINSLTDLNSKKVALLEQVEDNIKKLAKELHISDSYSLETKHIVYKIGLDLRAEIDNILEDIKKISEKISQKDHLDKRIITIDNKIKENENFLNDLVEKEKKAIGQLAQLSAKIEEYKKAIPENIGNITVLKAIIGEKTKELNDSKERLISLRKLSEDMSNKYEGEIAKAKEIENSIEELKLEVEGCKNNFQELMIKEGFHSKDQYEEAKLHITHIESLEREVEKYNTDVEIAKARLEDIMARTKDLVLVDMCKIEEELKVIQGIKEEEEGNLRNLHSILDNNRTILKNVEDLNKEFKNLEEEYKIVGELADLANGKKSPYISFERYILASYFEDIIDAANLRLEKMTGDRFSLIRKTTKSKGAGQKGLELEIYDNYTDTSRDVSSLSGGESFKASLSLALGLSDVVQSNSGGVSLDTMFVDEGFGTLDPQSLDNAIDSLLELQRGGRLVGIISHVEELKERVEAKLEVTATSKGSSAKFNIL